MSEFKDGYFPIEYANTNRTRFVIPFPEYVKPQQIGVNLRGLRMLLRIGGISHLRVAGQTDGETTRFTPTIVGYDSQGNAYAGKKGEKVTIPEFTTYDDEANRNQDASEWKPHSATWKNAVINLNINEMAERIRQEDKWARGVSSTEAWAYHLDKVVRKGVSDIGVRHLTLGVDRTTWGLTAFQYVLAGALEVSTGHPSIESMAYRILFMSLCMNLVHYIGHRNTYDGYRWSVLYGPQLDRALLLIVLSSRTNLVMASTENPHEKEPSSNSLDSVVG